MKISTIKCKNILTKTKIPGSDYVINPYLGCSFGCKYCYAAYMKRFSNHAEPWGQFVDVKLFNSTINTRGLVNKKITMSTATDPYLYQEAKYRVTRNVLLQLTNIKCKITILTKSALVCDDIPILKNLNNVTVAFSINTLDSKFQGAMDKAYPINKRLLALRKLHKNKIRTAVFISPIFPYITNWKTIIVRTKRFVNEYWIENLNLRQPYKKVILAYIQKKYPQHYKEYLKIYDKQNYSYWKKMNREIKSYCKQNKIKLIDYFYHEKIKKN